MSLNILYSNRMHPMKTDELDIVTLVLPRAMQLKVSTASINSKFNSYLKPVLNVKQNSIEVITV